VYIWNAIENIVVELSQWFVANRYLAGTAHLWPLCDPALYRYP